MHELGLSANLDQSSRGKLLKVVGERRRGDWEMTAEPAAGCFVATRDALQNFIAPWICQGFSDAMKVVGSHDSANAHQDYIIQRDDAKSDDATLIAVVRSFATSRAIAMLCIGRRVRKTTTLWSMPVLTLSSCAAVHRR